MNILTFSGGETIKGISQQSGARIELQRNPPPNADPNIKMFTVRGSPQQIDYARQLVEEKIGVRHESFDCGFPVGTLFVLCFFTDLNLIVFFRDQSLPWVAHMVPLVHMEARAHMVLLDHLDPPVHPWVRTTLDHTTRDLQDHSEYSYRFISPLFSQIICYKNITIQVLHVKNLWLFYFSHQWSSCTIPASGVGQWLSTLATGTA